METDNKTEQKQMANSIRFLAAEAIEKAKLHSRQYAKRQRTWFANKLTAQIILDHCYDGDDSVVKKIVN